MDCRKWQLVAVGLVLLCGGCAGLPGMVPVVPLSPAVPMGTAVLSSVTDHAVATPVPTASEDRSCPLTEPSPSAYCDKEVLLASRDALRGTDTDALRTWQRHNPLESFAGVRVDPSSGRVVAVEVQSKSLGGFIPPELGQLRQLQVLNLGFNWLKGPIPPELGQLSQLQELGLSHNRLMGIISSELGQLGQLQELGLSHNRLTGVIPPELGRLGQLQELNLSHNSLLGSVPAELGQLSHLQELNLANNQLTGSIPSELGQLGQLQVLGLSHNRLSGCIDFFPAGTLDARYGDALPLHAYELAGLTGLTTLSLQGETRFPAVPVNLLVHAPALESLDLSGNRRRLPPGFLAHAPGLRRLTLRNADPEVLDSRLPRLEILDLEVPASQAELPPDLLVHVPKLQHLTLKGAELTELPPDWLVHAPELRYLTLDTPRLTALPVDFQTDTSNLREIRDPGGCAVSAMESADRPSLLARFLEACGNP